jgi:hypothetical protein
MLVSRVMSPNQNIGPGSRPFCSFGVAGCGDALRLLGVRSVITSGGCRSVR